MNIHDWITICAVATVIVGWFVNSALNRRHEISKKRMEYRLNALHSFLPVFFMIEENHIDVTALVEKLSLANTKFQLYCHKNEIDAFKDLTAAFYNNEDITDTVSNLIRLVREGIRNELGLDKYEYDKS